MIKSLSIQNYALIDKIEIEFHHGFSVITGETGAGKSILLGALGLILGNRADLNIRKDKSKKCVVEGEFLLDKIDLEHFFSENDLDYDQMVILRREINSSGKSRAFINDTPVNLNLLKELGEQLVNIHSQHQTLNLGKFEFQLNVLDAFINNPVLLEEYQNMYRAFRKAEKKLQYLISRNQRLKTDEDYIRFQLSEFESVKLEKQAFEHLVDREQLLSHSEEIASGIMQCRELLDEGDTNAVQLLREVVHVMNKLSGYHTPIKSLAERLESVEIELSDISSEIAALSNETEFNPGELAEIKNKLDKYYHLQQKHHVQTVDELKELKERLTEQLTSIETFEDEIQKVKEEVSGFRKQTAQLSAKLHSERVRFAEVFSTEVKAILQQLGMKNALFFVEVTGLEEFNHSGRDRVEFLFTANKGGTPEQIDKVASGGELSRLMLAVKSLINQRNVLPTVVFDEIDAGVSGEIAGKVGTILKKMSGNHQVLAITHLPQIASKAGYHYHVVKTEETETALTKIELLDNEGRVEAIARMLSDEKVTETSVKAAQELLQ